MKLIITEEQYRILKLYEQPNSKFDRLAIALTSRDDKEFLQRMKVYDKFKRGTVGEQKSTLPPGPSQYLWSSGYVPKTSDIVNTDPSGAKVTIPSKVSKEEQELYLKNLTWDEFFDNSVDIVSATLEAIPGIGNLGSASLDIAHSLSFFLRAYLATDNITKIENIINGLSTGVMATIPLAGNLANVGFRGTINKFLNMTHSDVTRWLKQNGINIKSGVFLLNKNSFSPNILAALYSFFKGEATEFDTLKKVGDFLTNISKKLSEILKKINEIKNLPFFNKIIESLQYIINLINEMKEVLKSMI